MYAVIISGGKQHKITEGETLKVEKLVAEPGTSIDFEQVLLVAADDAVKVGDPYVKGAKVSAEVISHGRGKKIKIIKFKRRKHYDRQMGHRQDFTELKITKIVQ